MPKYVPRLEGIMHDPEGECIMPSNLGTYFGIQHGQHNIIVIITLNVFGDLNKLNLSKMY
jgi:hypothetical protein